MMSALHFVEKTPKRSSTTFIRTHYSVCGDCNERRDGRDATFASKWSSPPGQGGLGGHYPAFTELRNVKIIRFACNIIYT